MDLVTSISATLFDGDVLTKIKDREKVIIDYRNKIAQYEFEVQQLKRFNAENTIIRWKDSIKWCLEVDKENPFYFIKNTAYVAKCIANKHGVEITRDIKNKISTTLSVMYNQKEIGRIQYNGNTFYGLPEFFEAENLDVLKKEYQAGLDNLRQ